MTPLSHVRDARYWRTRAEEARAAAGGMRDPRATRTLLALAENYEQLAAQAQDIAAACWRTERDEGAAELHPSAEHPPREPQK